MMGRFLVARGKQGWIIAVNAGGRHHKLWHLSKQRSFGSTTHALDEKTWRATKISPEPLYSNELYPKISAVGFFTAPKQSGG
ncbi:hypothetical protein, partial [Pseudomonas sp. KCJK8993]|uniref:hypothetical protein n=1 Tax=Pseudomonas sp. KCJK8993 TaxID=3344565 RepID=UPI0039069730